MTTNEKPHRGKKKIWAIIGIVIVAVVAVSSLIYAMNMRGSAPSPPAGPNVTIWDTGFCANSGNCGYSPTGKNATLGTTITWTNTGGQPHTVTECTNSDSATACPNGAGSNNSGSRAFDSNAQYSSGFRKDQQFAFAFSTSSGTFYYYCTLHPWMHGTIVVTKHLPEKNTLLPADHAEFQSETRPLSAPILSLEHAQNFALKSFGNSPRFPVFLPCPQSLDCALNHVSRPETLPDRKSPHQKGGGVLAIASRDARAVLVYLSETESQGSVILIA